MSWYRSNASSAVQFQFVRKAVPASIQSQTNIDPLAKRHSNGVSLAGRYWPAFIYAYSHRTTGCLDDRLLTMMTDTGFYVP